MGKKYKITHGTLTVDYGGLNGLCVMPDRFEPKQRDEFWIWLHEKLRGEKKLDILIHELLHAEHPDMAEDEVKRTATVIARVLTGEGWREKR